MAAESITWAVWLGLTAGSHAEWLGVWGSVASLVSLASLPFSAYAAFKIRAISRRIAFNARADDILREIEEAASGIGDLMPEYLAEHHKVRLKVKKSLAMVYRTKSAASTAGQSIIKKLEGFEREYDQIGPALSGEEVSVEEARLVWRILEQFNIYTDDMRDLMANRRVSGSNDT